MERNRLIQAFRRLEFRYSYSAVAYRVLSTDHCAALDSRSGNRLTLGLARTVYVLSYLRSASAGDQQQLSAVGFDAFREPGMKGPRVLNDVEIDPFQSMMARH